MQIPFAIKTTIDGYKENVSIYDLHPQQDTATGVIDVTLYKNVQDNWEANKKLNGGAVNIPIEVALADADSFSYSDISQKHSTLTWMHPRESLFLGLRIPLALFPVQTWIVRK